MESKIYLGIDNGLNGGIVALSPHGKIIDLWKMPVQKVLVKTKKCPEGRLVNEVDTRGLVSVINDLNSPSGGIVAIFEHCPYHAASSNAMRSMGVSAGKVLALLELKGIETMRILSNDWQPIILGKVPSGKTKQYALAKAKKLWNDENFHGSARSKVAHDGLVDAALIAEFGRKNYK